MGLLFDENKQVVTLFVNHCNKLSFLSLVASIISGVALVLEGYVDSTYFSENALLPGYVNRQFNGQPYLSSALKRLQVVARSSHGEIPSEWLVNEFNSIGLHAYEHNYTMKYPFTDQVVEGKSVYAILEASRAPSTEALVICSPYRSPNSMNEQTLPGISLLLSLAKYFSNKNYMAKDLIFLVADKEEIGFHAWLDAYHQVDSSYILNYDLEAKSGQIQAAINLEIQEEDITQMDIKIEGINGQLPNLDLFNVAVELATRESITPTFHGKAHPFSADFYEVSKDFAQTTVSMMVSQAKTTPTGAHGIFHKFSIQAITLKGIGKTKDKQKEYLSVPVYVVGRVVEGIARSLNNLLERFNRSYWFYLLPSTRRYISIGYYMIPFCLMTIPLLFKALNIYMRMEVSLWSALPFNFYCHILGLVMACLPCFLNKFSWIYRGYNLNFREAIYYSLIVFSFLIIFNPLVKMDRKSVQKLQARQVFVLINLALILACLSLLNISLSLFLAVLMVPLTYSIVSVSNNFLRKLLSPLVILIHPLAINFLCLFASSMLSGRKSDIVVHLERAFLNSKITLLNQLEDWYIYGNWIFFFGSAFLFPVWLQIVSLLQSTK